MPGRDRLRNLACHLDADMVGKHQFPARLRSGFRHAQSGGKNVRGRVGQQPVDAVLGYGQLRIVIIVGMDPDAIGKRGESDWRLHRGTDHGGFRFGDTQRLQISASDPSRPCYRAG